MHADPSAAHVMALHEAAWLVRHYRRPVQRVQRAQAILKLGLTVREAFGACDDFEPMLIALVDGLHPQDYVKPF
jgi:hypothetical protein